MDTLKRFGVMLDEKCNDKLRRFSFEHSVTQSQLFRSLVKYAKVDKINVKSSDEIIKEGWGGDRKDIRKIFLVDEETMDKLKKIRMKNSASYSEIMRQLIEHTNFDKLDYLTHSKHLSEVKAKIKTEKDKLKKK